MSVVAPAFNEAANIHALYSEVKSAIEPLGHDFELLIVDNGSTDNSLEILKDLRSKDSRVGFVSLSRNFGHQGGLIAGLEHSRGDVVISMDADLQHPPAAIVDMLEQWRKGFDVVGARRSSEAGTSRLRRWTNRAFYGGVWSILGMTPATGQSDFRLMDRHALDALLALPEKDKFLRGLSSWIGFRQTSISFAQRARQAGETKFSLVHLIALTVSAISAFSILPLRLFTVIGLVVATSSVIYAIYVLASVIALGTDSLPPGWATLAIAVLFLGGVQLMGIGILGEYLGRTLGEVRARPAYVVQEADTGSPEKDKAVPNGPDA